MTLKLDRDPLVWEVDEETLIESKELHVILSLNSIGVIELADRLELDDALSIDDEVRADVSDVLALVKDWDDALGLVIDARLSQGYFECAVIYGFGIAWAERGPDVFSDALEKVIH
jgi:hypothetical protein